MAKFTKLNIGDSVASSGGRAWKKLSSMLQLSAPTLSLDGDMLTITENSGLATLFDVLVDGEVKGTATGTTFDLSSLKLESGTYSVSVIAKADGYIDSAESEAVSYEVAADELAGTWYFNDKPNQNYRGNSYTGISFTVGSHGTVEHNRIDFDYSSRDLFFYQSSGYYYIAYDHSKSAWWASGTRTIHVATLAKESPRLLDFLKYNATKQ